MFTKYSLESMLPKVHFKMKQISMRKTSLIQKYKQIIYSTGFPMEEVTFCFEKLVRRGWKF